MYQFPRLHARVARSCSLAALVVAAAATGAPAQTSVGPLPPAIAVPVPPILPNDGLVGGWDQNLGRYRMYLMPGLGTNNPGAPAEVTLPAAFAAHDYVDFVIDQANANVVALAQFANGTGPVEVWRLDFTAPTVATATLLTTLTGTSGLLPRAIHRDASGCILALCRSFSFGPTFTVHRVAVTRGGAMGIAIPIANPAADMIEAIATDPTGRILLGGRRAPYLSSAPGVTLSVSQAGGTPTVLSVIPGYHVISAETDVTGVPVLGLSPLTLPAAANFSCGGGFSLFQYNGFPYTTLFTDIERNPAGTQFVLIGSGFFAAGGPGGLIRIGAVGCTPGVPSVPVIFPHGLGSVAIAFPSQNYGCACVPSTNVVPQIVELAPPVIGTQWRVGLVNGVPNATAMLISGRTDVAYQGAPLPQSLAVLGGQPHGFLLTNPLNQYPVLPTDAAGAATNGRQIPNAPALIGTLIFSQWLVFEAAGGVPAFSTAGLASVVQ